MLGDVELSDFFSFQALFVGSKERVYKNSTFGNFLRTLHDYIPWTHVFLIVPQALIYQCCAKKSLRIPSIVFISALTRIKNHFIML